MDEKTKTLLLEEIKDRMASSERCLWWDDASYYEGRMNAFEEMMELIKELPISG